MTLLQSIILGIVQGATEFLPISSSGHIVLVPSLFGWDIPEQDAFVFNVLIQAATLIAVFYYFWNDLLDILKSASNALIHRSFKDHDAQLGLYIILATIPAGLVGFFFIGFFEDAFSNPLMAAIFLLGTAGLLVIAERAGNKTRSMEQIGWKDALWIGCFQVLALFPGISRSGATITGGMLRDLDRTTSARFSFLISVPLMIGAGGNALVQFIQMPGATDSALIYLAGCIVAAIVGYLSIKWLLKFLSERSLYTFAIYCVVFAAINLIFLAL